MLKPSLSRGEIQCIGATTLNDYRKYVERDAALTPAGGDGDLARIGAGCRVGSSMESQPESLRLSRFEGGVVYFFQEPGAEFAGSGWRFPARKARDGFDRMDQRGRQAG